MTSIPCSAASDRSVKFQGEELPLDVAIKRVVNETQAGLNKLELILFDMAQIEMELGIEDRDEDDYMQKFKRSLEMEYQVCDHVEGLSDLLEELCLISHEIHTSIDVPPGLKEWLKIRKGERKVELVQRKERAKQLLAEERAREAAEKREENVGLTTTQMIAKKQAMLK